jgi:hypothetical protein
MSILETLIDHWNYLNILIITGMHIYELAIILEWQWHSMQDSKIHCTLLQVLALISSCIPWINSIPIPKCPYLFLTIHIKLLLEIKCNHIKNQLEKGHSCLVTVWISVIPVVQLSSSDPSQQSIMPSHLLLSGTQEVLLPQWKWDVTLQAKMEIVCTVYWF